jgi:hypothetical protein
MHTKQLVMPLRKAVDLDDTALAPLGVCSLLLDAVDPADQTVEVYLEIVDGSDDAAILRYIRAL